MIDSLLTSGFVTTDVPLGQFTTYKAGGPAKYFADVSTADQIDLLIDAVGDDMEVLILGRGSNLLVADPGFPGLVIRLGGAFGEISVNDDLVTAGASVPLPRLARHSVDSGLRGLEFFVGVPGSVGGAVRQNAGCFGTEVVDCLLRVTMVDLRTGRKMTSKATELDLSYRSSNVKSTDLILSATFEASAGDSGEGKGLMREITRWRKENQPGGTFNAGSVFKNPEGSTAGEIIDALGLKGLSIGEVAVSQRHANFFVAGPGASSADIWELVALVKATVEERTGTILVPEIQMVGFDDDD